MKKIIAFGNPLLDTIVSDEDNKLLNKYNLLNNGQKEISQDEMISLSKDAAIYERTVTAGGCAQNTLKVMQWLVGKQWSATIFGSIGKDDNGSTLKRILNENGVQTEYIIRPDYHTGTTLALVNGDNRSLVACLGAAEVVRLDEIEPVFAQIRNADLVYMEGFFLTKRFEAAKRVLSWSKELQKPVAFNFCGEYLCKTYSKEVEHFFNSCDIVLGNKAEFEAFFDCSDVKSILELYKELKVLVVTDGSKAVMGINGNGKLYEIQAPALKPQEVVDTTGAGDSFAGGFLVGYVLGKEFDECLKLGCYAAQEIIKNKGCTLPDHASSFAL